MQKESDDDAAADRKIIREEFRAYVVELLQESGVEDKNPWHWAMGIIRCVVKWERRAAVAFEKTWQTLLILSITAAAGWLATAYLKWSGAGW